jgi:hypothetical protein
MIRALRDFLSVLLAYVFLTIAFLIGTYVVIHCYQILPSIGKDSS